MRRLPLIAGLILAILIVGALGVAAYRHFFASRTDDQLRQAREALAANDLVTVQTYIDLLDDAGDGEQARLLEAEVSLAKNEPARALAILQRISPDGPLRIDAAFAAARCLMAMRRPPDAEASLLRVLQEQPDHAEAHRWAGVLYHDQGDFPRAVEHLKRTADLLPADGRALRLVGLIYKDLENHREAVAAYRESLRRDPAPRDAAAVRTELAESLLTLFDAAGALEVLGDASGATADAVRAEALVAVGREGEAITVLEAALQAKPDHPSLLRLRAERHRAHDELEAAAKLLDRVLARDPHDLKCRNLMAQVCEARGQSRAAAEHLAKMKATQKLMEDVQAKNHEAMGDPWNARVRLELAELCDRLGRKEMAAMWRRAAAACPARK